MIYLKAFLFIFVDLAVKYLIAWPLTPLVVLFAKSDGNLPNWLYWFGTPDNTLDGDGGWKSESRPYRQENTPYQRYINRCHWLWRNSAYGFGEQVLGIKYSYGDALGSEGDLRVSNGPMGLSGLVKRYLYRGNTLIAFQWYYVRRYKIFPNKCIRINFGWKLWGFRDPKYPVANFVFSPSPFMHFIE